MNKKSLFISLLFMLVFSMSLIISGCSGDDGATGPQGEPGEKGDQGEQGDPGEQGEQGDSFTISAEEAHTVSYVGIGAEIVGVVLSDGTITVNYTVDGVADSMSAEYTIAKWVESENTWISMLQRNVTSSAEGAATVVRAGNLRPGSVSGSDGVFSYTLSSGGSPIDFRNGAFWTNSKPAAEGAYGDYINTIIEDIEDKAVWDENGIYRIGVTSRQNERFTAIAYIDGTGAQIEAAQAPNQGITAESCISCHGGNENHVNLPAHGARRGDPQLCTTCHNPYTYDSANSAAEADGWVNISLMTITHKIHSGIEGYNIAGYDYSNVRYPDWMDGRGSGPKNCTSCHKGDIPAYGTSWNKISYNECSSCHSDDTESPFNSGEFHFDKNCESCHSSGFKSVDTIHQVSELLDEYELARSYEMEIVSVENSISGLQPVVTWRVKKDGVYQDLFTGSETYSGRMQISIGWGYGDDFTNEGSGNSGSGELGRPFQVTIDAINTVQGVNNTTAVTTFPSALPAAAADGRFGFVALTKGAEEVNMPSVVKTFDLQASKVETFSERRKIVSMENCLSCHTDINRHGNAAANSIDACVMCHNAGSMSRDASVVQGTVDMMFLMHAIHSVTERKGEFSFERRRAYDYVDESDPTGGHDGYAKITYPRSITECSACHVDGSEKFPVDNSKRLGIIGDKMKAAYADGAGTGVISPMAAVCYSCHQVDDVPENNTIKAHFSAEGGNMFGDSNHEYYESRPTESCMICHE